MTASVRITSSTRIAGVMGHPVRHSLSPVLHNAAFRALDLDWAFLAFDVAPGDGRAAVMGALALGVEGLSVTMPHKQEVIGSVEELTPTAARLGAVNTVFRRGTTFVGDNTDGPGFLAALEADEGFDPKGRPCVVLGAGGAARAIVLALAQVAAAEVVVVGRNADRAAAAAALGGKQARVGRDSDIPGADLVVNATPVGMSGVGEGELPVPPELLRPGQLVVDLVYSPLRTPLLRAAKERGAVAVSGLGMLIHQAALAFRLWTGEDPPREAMSAAALAALAGDSTPARNAAGKPR